MRCNTAATQTARSLEEAKNNPRFPEVPEDSPTVIPSMVGSKSRLVSESTATCMASFKSSPHVLIWLKSRMNSAFCCTGNVSRAAGTWSRYRGERVRTSA